MEKRRQQRRKEDPSLFRVKRPTTTDAWGMGSITWIYIDRAVYTQGDRRVRETLFVFVFLRKKKIEYVCVCARARWRAYSSKTFLCTARESAPYPAAPGEKTILIVSSRLQMSQ